MCDFSLNLLTEKGLRMVEIGGAIIFTSVVGFDGILKDLSKRD